MSRNNLLAASSTFLGIEWTEVTAYLIALFVLLFVGLLLFRLFKVPIKILGRLLLNSLLGGGALFLINYVMALFFNYKVPINIFNAIFVGILGIPGLITIIILNFIL
jgi:inhibitor of the pro-sigma K processing machinery